ncbi:hypothetical protein FYZ37_07450 [Mobiluncus curtisii]|nr:hypothetical protein [Mobiluncus curtisii]MCV0001049.1 hypothetical protein [Mobiluncus curtisii]
MGGKKLGDSGCQNRPVSTGGWLGFGGVDYLPVEGVYSNSFRSWDGAALRTANAIGTVFKFTRFTHKQQLNSSDLAVA